MLEKIQDLAPGQTPRLQVDTGGDFYLARSQRRRIRQTALPADLQAAITDPNLYTRRGAISELSTRLRSENLPAALGAYEALTEVVRTDIEYVASFAATALHDAAIRPSENALHFGRVTRDDLPLRRTIRLLGPLIARECAVVPSVEWIRVERRADDLTVTVDTVRSGPLRGRVTLNGPTGEAAIEVDLELVDPAPKTPPGKQESGSTPTSGQSGSSDEQDGLLGRIFRSRTGSTSATRPRRGADVEDGEHAVLRRRDRWRHGVHPAGRRGPLPGVPGHRGEAGHGAQGLPGLPRHRPAGPEPWRLRAFRALHYMPRPRPCGDRPMPYVQ